MSGYGQPPGNPPQYGQQAYFAGGNVSPTSYPPPPSPGLEAGEHKYDNLPPSNPPVVVSRPKFEDVWATLLFIFVNVVFGVAAAIGIPETIKSINNPNNSSSFSNSYSFNSSTSFNSSSSFNSTRRMNGTSDTNDFTITGRDIGGVVGAAVGVGCAFSLGYFVLMILIAGPLIHITYWLSFLILLLITVYYMFLRIYVAGIIWGIFCVLFAVNYFLIRRRIPFAKWDSCGGIVGLVVSCGYSVVWIATMVGVGQRATYGVLITLLFILYWTMEVIRNTIHVSVSGTFATVYFTGVTLPNSKKISVPDTHITLKSTRRALTTSFGPICFGSLLVALIATLRAVADQSRADSAQNGNILCCLLSTCLSCILSCIQDILEYFNKYAYTQVAIYGKSYCVAARDTWRLVKARGLEAVVNDSLIGNISPDISETTINYAVVCMISFVIGVWLFLILAEVVTSGVATTYVCLAEDPATLARQQPELFARLYATWPEIQWGAQSSVQVYQQPPPPQQQQQQQQYY
ncbi:plasma-membrane choline transporter-domain-containing protein [Chytridium lagenaria]|nr:plasma-membrane choline transporter-domain-containing protein [Chytridium lagenaria]